MQLWRKWRYRILTKIVINFAIIFYLTGIFQTDIGDQMTIGLSDKGYKSVQLRCGSGSMLIELKTEEDFDGVIYTRGSFYDKNSPCFLDPATSKRRSFSIKFPLDQCNTQKVRKWSEIDVYSDRIAERRNLFKHFGTATWQRTDHARWCSFPSRMRLQQAQRRHS